MPPACGRERWYAVPKGGRDLRFERADYQTSDVRLALCLETYSPFMAGHMVQGDFSTPLRCARNDMCVGFIVPPRSGGKGGT